MRKFSKLLAVLLTVCVLCGVVASFAVSADDSDLTPTLGYATGLGTGSDVTVGGQSNGAYAAGINRDISAGYLHLTANTAATVPTAYAGSGPSAGLTLHGFYNGETSAWAPAGTTTDNFGINTENFIEYATFDFDFGIDGYRYFFLDAEGNEVVTTDEAKIDGMTKVDAKASISADSYYAEPAMFDDYNIWLDTYVDGAKYFNVGKAWIVLGEDGKYYYANNADLKSATYSYPLASTVGAYDHFTYVYKIVDADTNPEDDNDEGATTKSTDPVKVYLYLYINGEYVSTLINGKAVTTNFGILRYYYSFTKADFVKDAAGTGYDYFAWRDNYDVSFRNTATNFYTQEDLEKTTLDEFMEGNDYDTNFFGVTNIVANENYVTPNYKDGYVEYGGKSYYFTALGLAYAEETIKSGETITVSGISVSDFAPQGDVANFIVKLLNGASFASNSSFDRYAYAPDTDIYIINETNISGKGRLDVTGDVENVTEDFTSATTANLSYNDGDQIIGLLESTSNGYLRIYSNGGRAHYGGVALRSWPTTNGSGGIDNDKSNLFDASFTTVDFEFGSDRYVFSYTADVVRNQVTSGKNPGDTNTTENLTGVTFYQYVESREEFEAYLANPASLEGERTTTNKRSSNYTYTWNDTLSNVVINENSFTVALGGGVGGDITISTNLWIAKDGAAKSRVDTYDYKAYPVKDPATGLWYLSDAKGAYSASNNNILLSNELGVTDHITIVYDNSHLIDGALSYIIYVNGEYLSSAKMYDAATYSYVTLRGVGFLMAGAQKHITNFSLMMDDLAVNYYRSGVVYDNETTADAYVGVESFAPYTSGSDVYGIDDLIADLKAETKNPCTKALDLYFNENLITRDGWVSIDGGLTVLTSPTKIAEALATMTDYGAELITSRRITISSLPEGVTGFYIRPVRGGGVTLAGELTNTHTVVDYMDGLLELRELLDDEKLTVEFLDVDGSVYHTMILAPGVALEVPVYNYSKFNPSTGELVGFTKWVIDETGENAAGYKYYGYVTEGKKLTVVPVIENQGRINTFALYTLDENGEANLIGTKDDYLSLSGAAIKSAVENLSVDGATLVLLYDGAFDISSDTMINVSKNMSFDLNGRTLVHSKTATGRAYGANLFALADGVTFNLYSSKEGGEIYQAYYPGEKYVSGGDAWGSGIFSAKAASATLNVGAFDSTGDVCDDYSGNLGIYGGTIIFVDSYGTAYSGTKVDFKINIRGTEVYQATRSGYAAITARADGVTITLKDSKFYSNSQGSYYGAIYDYDYTKYYTKTYTTVDNCTFIGTNGYADYNAGKMRPLFSIGADSTLTMTNSTVYGSIGANEASLTLGEGNFIVGWGANLAKYPGMLGEGISYGTLDAYAGTSFAHPQLYMMNNVGGYDTIIRDGANYVLNPVAYDKEQWVTSTVAYKGVIYTYASDAEAPVYSTAKVDRYYGSKLKDTLDWVVGTEFGQIEVRANHIYHYAGNYVWGYENGNSAMGEVISGDTVLKLIDFETGAVEIKDMQANLTLKSDMKFNLYIPAKAGVSITSVSVGTLLPNTFTYGDVEYFVIVIDLVAGNFDAIELTVGYSVYNDAYGDYVVEFEDVMTIDYVTSYASIAAKSAACGSETALLLKEIIDYNVAVAKYLDPAFDETSVESIVAFREIYAAHNVADDPATEDVDESKSCVCDVALPEAEATDLSGVADYVTDATFYLESDVGVMGLILYAAEGYEGADLTVSFVDVNGNEVFADVEFIADKGYIMVSNIKAAYIANVMTITVGDAMATYSLATYIAETEDAAALAVANALLEYSVAAEAYKASVN